MNDDEDVLLVAVCNGHRCRHLRCRSGGADGGADGSMKGGADAVIRGAVRERADAVLVSLPCLGPCHRGAVAAIGTGIAVENGLQWTRPPVGLGLLDRDARAGDLAEWITGAAPDLSALPERLWRVGA